VSPTKRQRKRGDENAVGLAFHAALPDVGHNGMGPSCFMVNSPGDIGLPRANQHINQ